MRIFTLTLIAILILFLSGCAVQRDGTQLSPAETVTPNIINTASPTSLPSPTSGETEVFLTITSTPIGTIRSLSVEGFHFGAPPEISQVGGISGVFYRKEESEEETPSCPRTYNVLRFYEDGLVIYMPLCNDDTEDFLNNLWPNISKWFHRDNEDIIRGIYQITKNKIWFRIIQEYDHVVIDYFGTFSKDRLVLNSFSHYNGHEATTEFIYLDISNIP